MSGPPESDPGNAKRPGGTKGNAPETDFAAIGVNVRSQGSSRRSRRRGNPGRAGFETNSRA